MATALPCVASAPSLPPRAPAESAPWTRRRHGQLGCCQLSPFQRRLPGGPPAHAWSRVHLGGRLQGGTRPLTRGPAAGALHPRPADPCASSSQAASPSLLRMGPGPRPVSTEESGLFPFKMSSLQTWLPLPFLSHGTLRPSILLWEVPAFLWFTGTPPPPPCPLSPLRIGSGRAPARFPGWEAVTEAVGSHGSRGPGLPRFAIWYTEQPQEVPELLRAGLEEQAWGKGNCE